MKKLILGTVGVVLAMAGMATADEVGISLTDGMMSLNVASHTATVASVIGNDVGTVSAAVGAHHGSFAIGGYTLGAEIGADYPGVSSSGGLLGGTYAVQSGDAWATVSRVGGGTGDVVTQAIVGGVASVELDLEFDIDMAATDEAGGNQVCLPFLGCF